MADYANILTIAGSDSGGGAGIQADLKTITCLGGFGLSVICALTAQNGAEVRGVEGVPPSFVALQYATVRDGFKLRAAKTGMLANSALIETVADFLRHKDFPLVVDPVCVSQSGYKLLEDSAVSTLVARLLPLADILTPNLPEAELLSGVKVDSAESLRKAGEKLLQAGAKAVLIKGGHFSPDTLGGSPAEGARPGAANREENFLTDWLCLPGQAPKPLRQPRINTVNNHGTGCTLSAAIATFMGQGNGLEQSVIQAQAYLNRALSSAFNPGVIGVGPPNFLGGRGR